MTDFSPQYQKILDSPEALSTLLRGTKKFDDVVMGFPEDYKRVHKKSMATVFMNGANFYETMGARNRPEFLQTTIGLISRGTKTAVHKQIIRNSLFVTSRFDNQLDPDTGEPYGDPDWITLNGNVRNTLITDFNIYPEHTGKSLLTTAVIQLRHDVRW